MTDQLLSLAGDPSAWLALATLVVMEIVLGIDNLVFVALLSSKLPSPNAAKARRIGLGLSLIFRLLFLAGAAYIVHLTEPVFTILEESFSWRDLILIAGGLFLVFKATTEIHEHIEPDDSTGKVEPRTGTFAAVTGQIVFLDLVFSVDSIITAVGMTEHVTIMVVAVTAAVAVMLFASGPLAGFIRRNPTIVMLALGFLLLIGATLIADGFHHHFPRGYIYAAMAFSGAVEGLNMLARKKRLPRIGHEKAGAPPTRVKAAEQPAQEIAARAPAQQKTRRPPARKRRKPPPK